MLPWNPGTEAFDAPSNMAKNELVLTAPELATLPAPILAAVEQLWNYHQLNHTMAPSSAIFVLCSNDERVAVYAAELFLQVPHLAARAKKFISFFANFRCRVWHPC